MKAMMSRWPVIRKMLARLFGTSCEAPPGFHHDGCPYDDPCFR